MLTTLFLFASVSSATAISREGKKLRPKEMPADIQELIHSQADFIINQQLPSGAIPWYRGGITDPWDHVECAIALDLGGWFDEAAAAYKWSRDIQNPDGSWYSSYLDNEPQDLVKDTNFSSYIATGMWFHYLATKDLSFLRQMWPTIEKGITFALSLQHPAGEISWALSGEGAAWPGAILTSSCSIWQSIRNGIKIAETLGLNKFDWDAANKRLARAIKEHPESFDKFGENKRRYSMNWYYPILAGVIKGKRAEERMLKGWSDFIIDNWGCRVAADEDVTAVAETCELIMALTCIGERERAKLLLNWTLRLRDQEGGFCRGIKLPEKEAWPKERATWTSAALIMAVAAQAKT